MRARNVAASACFECEQRLDARGSVDDVVKNNRRRHDAIRRIVIGIETVGAPELFAGCRKRVIWGNLLEVKFVFFLFEIFTQHVQEE